MERLFGELRGWRVAATRDHVRAEPAQVLPGGGGRVLRATSDAEAVGDARLRLPHLRALEGGTLAEGGQWRARNHRRVSLGQAFPDAISC